jgi:hypothetical protein
MFLLFSILGLKASYFFRQLFFGAILAAFTLVKQDAKSLQFKDPDLFTIVPTLLCPYSRFLYEEIMRFLMGGNVFIMPALILLPFKFLMLLLGATRFKALAVAEFTITLPLPFGILCNGNSIIWRTNT